MRQTAQIDTDTRTKEARYKMQQARIEITKLHAEAKPDTEEAKYLKLAFDFVTDAIEYLNTALQH